ncbi:MAG TPA: spore germination protein GerW family protein [Actinoplanes sp.]|nr:spore germination protein GerW family protein [Actinoplanes sp.]
MTQQTNDARILESLRGVVDSAQAGRVFGDPVAHAGVVVLPAAKVTAGAGGGAGGGARTAGADHQPEGTGGGVGMTAKPLGAFVIRADGKVHWQPAIDINKVIMGGQIVAVTALLVARALISARRAGRMRHRGAARSIRRLRRASHRH